MAVAFDGDNKIITLTTATSFSFHDDIYAPAIDWAMLSGNMQYLIAVSGTGHSPVSSGVYTDSIFTLINNWTLQFNGYVASDIITITGTVTNGQDSIIAPASGDSPIISFAGYTNATIVTTGSGLSTEEHNQLFETLTEDNYLGLK